MTSATTALVVLVPEAEALVKVYRDKYDPSAMEGMPAHITVLYPFKKLDHLGEDMVANLYSLFSQHPCFHFALGEIQRFPTALYLAPRPETPFQLLTRAVAGQYPETHPTMALSQQLSRISPLRKIPMHTDWTRSGTHSSVPPEGNCLFEAMRRGYG